MRVNFRSQNNSKNFTPIKDYLSPNQTIITDLSLNIKDNKEYEEQEDNKTHLATHRSQLFHSLQTIQV